MKTWTNPTVEELEVKLTASMDHPFYHENANGWWDGNQYWGSNHGNGDDNNPGNDDNNPGSEETSGPNS